MTVLGNIWSSAWPILVAILLFALIIITHELGHFIFAKLFKVRVDEFAVGFGPTLFKFQKGETKYALRLIPLGGFCAMGGEEESGDDPTFLCNKPVWQRAIIMAAGAVFNLILGLIFMVILVAVQGQAITSTTVARFYDGALSCQTGLAEGDTILKIDGRRIYTADDISYMLMRAEDGKTEMTVRREDGTTADLKNVEFKTELDEATGRQYIVLDFSVMGIAKNPWTVLKHGLLRTVSMGRLVWMTLLDMLTGRYGLSDLSGPIGATQAMGQAVASIPRLGMDTLLRMLCLITVNLGIFNLLPIPALDGSKLVFLLVEAIRRKPIPPEKEGLIHGIGFAALVVLMVIVAASDIMKLIR